MLNLLAFVILAEGSKEKMAFSVSTWGLLKDENFTADRHLKELSKRYGHDLEVRLDYVDIFLKHNIDSEILCETFKFDERNFIFYAIGDYNKLRQTLAGKTNSTFKIRFLMYYHSKGNCVFSEWRTKILKHVGHTCSTLKFVDMFESAHDERIRLNNQSKETMFKFIKSLALAFPKRARDLWWFGNFTNVNTYFEAFCEVKGITHDGSFAFSSQRYLEYISCKKDKIVDKSGNRRFRNLFKDEAEDYNEFMSLLDVVEDIEDICDTMPFDINYENKITISKVVSFKLGDYSSEWLHKHSGNIKIAYMDNNKDKMDVQDILFVIVNDQICIQYDELKAKLIHYVQLSIENMETPEINLYEYEFY